MIKIAEELDISLETLLLEETKKDNDDLKVIGMHVFPYSEGDMFPYYDIKCYNCNIVFAKQIFLPIKEI